MHVESSIPFEQFQISQSYLDKSTDLVFVEQAFKIETIAHQISRRDLQSQFQLIRAITETKKHRLKLRVNSILQNKKNRYPEQSIYEHSRIKIMSEQTISHQNDYINANCVPSPLETKLIITQAPLQSTQSDFEAMIIQEKIECVVMLCNIIESGKVRCYNYIDNRQSRTIQNHDGVIEIKQVTLTTVDNGALIYTHIHYSEWPDRGVPQNNSHLLKIISQMMKFKRIAIHCSAGLGRSGVVSTLYCIQKQLSLCEQISVFRTVRRLREHRFGAVQNNEQYRFIYQYLRFINESG